MIDFTMLSQNFGKTFSGAPPIELGAVVPEPSLALLLVVTLSPVRRRCSRDTCVALRTAGKATQAWRGLALLQQLPNAPMPAGFAFVLPCGKKGKPFLSEARPLWRGLALLQF